MQDLNHKYEGGRPLGTSMHRWRLILNLSYKNMVLGSGLGSTGWG